MPPPKVLKRKGAILIKGMKPGKKGIKKVLIAIVKYGVLFLIVAIYAIGGAYILMGIESGAENERIKLKKEASENIKLTKDYIISYVWYHSSKPYTQKEFTDLATNTLNMYQAYIVESAQNSYYDGKPNEWTYEWTFSKSLLFTVTTMGAIGYGHITPDTMTGQFFTIYYGMIGVPLLLLFLAIIGDFLANSFKYIYSRLCCRWCRIRRVLSETKQEKPPPKILWKDEVGNEAYMPTKDTNVPIVINLCVIFIYLMMGGALFMYWEGWEMTASIYFTFITLSTIGFGDFVPGNSFRTGSGTFVSSMKMLVTIAFCMFGMALISMAINLMQEQLVMKTKWLAQEIGLGSKTENSNVKYVLKKHEPGTVQETPQGRDGNQERVAAELDEKGRRKSVIFA